MLDWVDSCRFALVPRLRHLGVIEQQLNLLKDLGCDIVQGYYISRPMPSEEFLLWLERNDLPKS